MLGTLYITTLSAVLKKTVLSYGNETRYVNRKTPQTHEGNNRSTCSNRCSDFKGGSSGDAVVQFAMKLLHSGYGIGSLYRGCEFEFCLAGSNSRGAETEWISES